MLTTPHFLAGAVIASKIPSFWPAAVAAVVLHLVLDALPHKDTIGSGHLYPANVIFRLADNFLALLLFFILVAPHRWVYAFVIATIGMIPDIIELPSILWPRWQQLSIIKQFSYWHRQVLQYTRSDMGWIWGLLPQIIIVAVAIYFLVG